ncbi:ATP-binding protein [Kitasatospora sp. NPDC101183]|uniref:ATP-binding protein n=1 Tax=Kitasatospora sp. NPDC101183 TaxID=3364100 RepID=UPI00382E0FCE
MGPTSRGGGLTSTALAGGNQAEFAAANGPYLLRRPFGRWGETFSADVVAAAMIDRLDHHAEALTLTGDSYRTQHR